MPTDTAGYTEIVFAPRIRDLGAQRLYRLDAPPRKEGVAVLLKGLIRSKTLLDNWDELLRVAGSLKLGRGTASLLVSKLQTGARENVLSRALRDLGRLVKTQFLPVLLVAPLALDVIGLGAGRLPSSATSDTHFQVIDCHLCLLPDERGPYSVSLRETPVVPFSLFGIINHVSQTTKIDPSS